MRRRYAFEAEGVSDEVKSQLEKVEDTVEEKCESTEACDKILNKIDSEESKFNDALKGMSDAAKDCKDGKCDKAEMAEKISPKMAELKEVAKSIGVASEGETLTEQELKDAKDYLEGAKEIVESKKDELGGDSDKKSDDAAEDKESDADIEDETEDEEDVVESFVLESNLDFCEADMAMEGANIDAIKLVRANAKQLKTVNKEIKHCKKIHDFAGASKAAKKGSKLCNDTLAKVKALPATAGSAVLAGLAVLLGGAAYGALICCTGGAAAGVGAVAGGAGAGVGAGSVLGVTAIGKLAKNQKAIQNGKMDVQKLTAADANCLLVAIKSDLANTAKIYDKAAREFGDTASKRQNDQTRYAGESEIFEGLSEMDAMVVESNLDFCEADMAMEGANIDAIKLVRANAKELKAINKEIKHATKIHDFSGAVKAAKKGSKLCNDTLKKVESLDAGVGSAVLAGLAVLVGSAAYGALFGIGLGAAGMGATAAGGAAGGAIGGSVALAGTAIGKVIKNQKAIQNGSVDVQKLSAADANYILVAIKNDLTNTAKRYEVIAQNRKDSADKDRNDKTRYAGESDTDLFEGFISACESAMIEKSEVPYLFD